MTAEDDGKGRKRRGMLVPLVAGLVLAIAAGGGAFWAVTSGPFAPEAAESAPEAVAEQEIADLPSANVVFVPLEPLVISLGPDVAGRHLMFAAALEVPAAHEAEVLHLLPRVLDVLNGYLRVVRLSELSDPTSLATLRAQILRRIQVVTGPGRVQDLLVTQFVVN